MQTQGEFMHARLLELTSFFRLPGFLHTSTLMAFWGCNRSTVSRRMKWIHHHNLAIIRSEHFDGPIRWYWIDPYIDSEVSGAQGSRTTGLL